MGRAVSLRSCRAVVQSGRCALVVRSCSPAVSLSCRLVVLLSFLFYLNYLYPFVSLSLSKTFFCLSLSFCLLSSFKKHTPSPSQEGNFFLLPLSFILSMPNAPPGPFAKNSYKLFSLRSVPLLTSHFSLLTSHFTLLTSHFYSTDPQSS